MELKNENIVGCSAHSLIVFIDIPIYVCSVIRFQKTMEGVSDDRILAMAKRIGDNPKLRKLALNLGSEMEEADRFIKMNRMNGEVSYEGTRIMLCTWREDTPRKEQWATLKTALIDAGLAGIADEFSSKFFFSFSLIRRFLLFSAPTL